MRKLSQPRKFTPQLFDLKLLGQQLERVASRLRRNLCEVDIATCPARKPANYAVAPNLFLSRNANRRDNLIDRCHG